VVKTTEFPVWSGLDMGWRIERPSCEPAPYPCQDQCLHGPAHAAAPRRAPRAPQWQSLPDWQKQPARRYVPTPGGQY